MRSVIRNAVTYDGQKLISIDIKNSQPYLSTILLSRSFWIEQKNEPNAPNELSITFDEPKKSSFYSFNNINKNNCTLYEFLEQQFSQRLGETFANRKEVKTAVFQVLFTDNRFLGQEDAKPKKMFKEMFPNVYEVFRQIKSKDKSLLPRLLQSIESYLMINVIASNMVKHLETLKEKAKVVA